MIPLLNQMLSIINSTGNYVYAIYNAIVTRGLVTIVQDASTVAHDIQSILNDPTCGQEAQCTKLDNLATALSTLASDISALGSPQQTGSPVTLPTTPPTGYGGASTGDIATAVWQYIPGGFSRQMGEFMENAGLFAINLGTNETRFAVGDQMRWTVTGPWTDSSGPDLPDRDVPNLDPNTILPTDANIADWINRVQPGYGATLTSEGWATIVDGGSYNYFYDMSPWEFNLIRVNVVPKSFGALVAPVWPGLSGVTLGTPVAISRPGQTISVPCDGVIIAIATTETSAGKFSFDTAISWRNAGALSFFDDNGEQEFPQSLGFEDCVYVPQSLAHAAGVRLRYSSILSGTVTPFNIN